MVQGDTFRFGNEAKLLQLIIFRIRKLICININLYERLPRIYKRIL
jgi:hypothetical protein